MTDMRRWLVQRCETFAEFEFFWRLYLGLTVAR